MAGPFPHIFHAFISVHCSVVGAGLKLVTVVTGESVPLPESCRETGPVRVKTEAAVARKGDTVQVLLVGQVGQVQLEIKLFIFYLALLLPLPISVGGYKIFLQFFFPIFPTQCRGAVVGVLFLFNLSL